MSNKTIISQNNFQFNEEEREISEIQNRSFHNNISENTSSGPNAIIRNLSNRRINPYYPEELFENITKEKKIKIRPQSERIPTSPTLDNLLPKAAADAISLRGYPHYRMKLTDEIENKENFTNFTRNDSNFAEIAVNPPSIEYNSQNNEFQSFHQIINEPYQENNHKNAEINEVYSGDINQIENTYVSAGNSFEQANYQSYNPITNEFSNLGGNYLFSEKNTNINYELYSQSNIFRANELVQNPKPIYYYEENQEISLFSNNNYSANENYRDDNFIEDNSNANLYQGDFMNYSPQLYNGNQIDIHFPRINDNLNYQNLQNNAATDFLLNKIDNALRIQNSAMISNENNFRTLFGVQNQLSKDIKDLNSNFYSYQNQVSNDIKSLGNNLMFSQNQFSKSLSSNVGVLGSKITALGENLVNNQNQLSGNIKTLVNSQNQISRDIKTLVNSQIQISRDIKTLGTKLVSSQNRLSGDVKVLSNDIKALSSDIKAFGADVVSSQKLLSNNISLLVKKLEKNSAA